MTERKCIYAHTPPGFAPPFISIYQEEAGSITVNVRGVQKEVITDAVRGSTKLEQPHASIDLGAQIELVNMFDAIGQHLFGEVVMALMSQALFNISSLPPEEIVKLANNVIPLAEKVAQS
jgi:hypothetical protein